MAGISDPRRFGIEARRVEDGCGEIFCHRLRKKLPQVVAYAKLVAVDPSVPWVIAGLALAISELLTGTFYLIVLGIAAFGAAAAAYFGLGFAPQMVVAAAVAAVGCY